MPEIIIKVPRGTIVKIEATAMQLKRSMYVELVEELADRYIGKLVELDDDKDKAGC